MASGGAGWRWLIRRAVGGVRPSGREGERDAAGEERRERSPKERERERVRERERGREKEKKKMKEVTCK